MKKFYVSTVVCLILSIGLNAQYIWDGAVNNDWNNPGNWTGGAAYPSGPGDDVVFNTPAQVNLNEADLVLNSIRIMGSVTVRITSNNEALGIDLNMLQVNSILAATPALKIDLGCTLEMSVTRTTGATGEGFFYLVFGDNAISSIDGIWRFTSEDNNDFSSFILPASGAPNTAVNVNSAGSIVIANGGNSPFDHTPAYLRFNSGSTFELARDGGIVPAGVYHSSSTVLVTGIISNGITFDQTGSIGNLTYSCAAQTDTIGLDLGNAVTIGGNLQFLNTNNRPVVLAGVGSSSTADEIINITIPGSLTIQGQSSVVVSKMEATNRTVNLNIGGHLAAGGTAFNIQTNHNENIKPTTVFIKGNLQHTSGVFSASSNLIEEATDKLIVEMNGSVAQTIFSHNGAINNGANQITLRINNSHAGGVTLLSPLTVGRLSFGLPNKGRLFTTSTNVLTINNISGNPIVVNGASNAGFVSGPVRRRTASATPIALPTGGGAELHETIVIPAGAGVTTYEATFFNQAHGDPSTISPLNGIADYYYSVERIAGAENASVRLPFNAAIDGATGADALLPAKYNNTDWVNARGTTGSGVIPGDAANGFVTTDLQSVFGLYTIGYGSQSALPTHLVSFTAKKESGSVALVSWKITDNSTPAEFEVMRSADGVNFSKIGTVAGEEGKHNYRFTDSRLAAGNNFYRLRMLDKDGVVTFSTIIAVMNGAKGVLITSIMPTLVSDRMRLSVSASTNGNLQLVITDMHGRIIQQQVAAVNTGNQEIWISAGGLAAGVYQVTGYINGDKTKTFRFIRR